MAASAPAGACERIEELLKSGVGWDEILRLAERHGASPLMYRNLERFEREIPAGAFAVLRERNEINIRKALFLTRELFRVLDCLNALGIEAIPYKGIVLSENYYGDMALRQCGDLDLFVRARDMARVKSAMRELGFTARVEIPAEAENDYIAAGYECSFDSPAGKNLLELQWALEPRYYAVDIDMEGLFARAVEVNFAGRQMLTLSVEDSLLVLAIHAAKHVWGRLIWLCDIERILQRELDWVGVRNCASGLGVQRILHVTLALAERFFGARVPGAVESDLRNDRVAWKFAEEIAESIAAGVDYETRKVSYFRLMMGLRERRMDRLRFLTRLTFTPGPGEWDAVKLPRILFPFYRVVRMARLAGRLVRV
ncbi:MAG TPA: nucleotidyltransferase family protein [Candidatus Sulfotelmatobacter sp.]